MVAAVSATPASRHQKHPSPARRPPLTLSEKDNGAAVAGAAAERRSRTKEISSRYLSSSTLSSSSLSSTSTSYSTNTIFSSSSSSSSLSSRRFPSPLVTARPSTPSALPQFSATPKRSNSVDRVRSSTPRAAAVAPAEPPSAASAARALCTTTRSLSVSFQGESFFYQTSRAKTASPSRARKPSPTPTPERRRASAATPMPTRAGDHSENARPLENHHHRWPAAARPQASNPLRKSLDCSSEMRDPIFARVRLLQQSMVFDDRTRKASFDGTDLLASSDTESASSGSNSGATEYSFPSRPKAISRGLSVPARFLQETNSRLQRLTEPTSPLSSPVSIQQKTLLKKFSMENSCSSPRSHSSPLRGPIRPSSPSRVSASPIRSMASPLRATNSISASISPGIQPANAPSIISFAAEVRRAKKGENRIEEAHLLRLFDNRNLQWRVVNARVDTLLSQQMLIAEKNLFSGWMTTLGLRDSVTTKRIKLQLLRQNLKLTSILKLQTAYLEEWSLLEREHSNSLSGATEALRASTLRLPVGGAKADIQELKNAIGSAVDMMQAMASSMCSLLSKVEGTSSLISEIAAMSAQERALLKRSRDLLSTVAAMHVTQCSLKGRIIQLKPRASKMQV